MGVAYLSMTVFVGAIKIDSICNVIVVMIVISVAPKSYGT